MRSQDDSASLAIQGGDILHERYQIEDLICTSNFGALLRARDLQSGEEVALKIALREERVRKQARNEINFLRFLNQFDHQRGFIVRMRDEFVHAEHQCIVLEYLAQNLYDFLRDSGPQGLSLSLIKTIAWQLLAGLSFLSLPNVSVIHGDLKPENIMLRELHKTGVKIIDFGSSAFQSSGDIAPYVQSRFYRAPEVLFQARPYTTKIDLWSLGCILYELYTGEALFFARSERDLVERMLDLRGPPPVALLRRSAKRSTYFEEVTSSSGEPQLRWKTRSSASSQNTTSKGSRIEQTERSQRTESSFGN